MPRPGNYLPPERDPDGPAYDFRSNVFYDWGGDHSGYDADTGDKASHSVYNFVDNYYKAGPASRAPIAFYEQNPLAKAWFAGNAMNGTIPTDPWSLVSGRNDAGYRLPGPIPFPAVTPDPAPLAYNKVLASAGASNVRDAVDARIVASVRAGTGRLIDSQTDVGGWPQLAAGKPWKDSDGDGMPDDWERAHRLDPHDAADGAADSNGDGYTNLEDWLNSLAAPKPR